MQVKGFSHVTINVQDLARALQFYVDVLGMQVVHHGAHDAYLEWGAAWVCLQEQALPEPQAQLGVDYAAFHLDEADFPAAMARLQAAGGEIARGPLQRGTGWAVNFLDPDGTQLELHTATLAERMRVWR